MARSYHEPYAAITGVRSAHTDKQMDARGLHRHLEQYLKAHWHDEDTRRCYFCKFSVIARKRADLTLNWSESRLRSLLHSMTRAKCNMLDINNRASGVQANVDRCDPVLLAYGRVKCSLGREK